MKLRFFPTGFSSEVTFKMRILALADINDFNWKHGAGQADLVVSSGDVADQVILEAAEAYSCKTIFAAPSAGWRSDELSFLSIFSRSFHT